jgi:hypothetical protein
MIRAAEAFPKRLGNGIEYRNREPEASIGRPMSIFSLLISAATACDAPREA